MHVHLHRIQDSVRLRVADIPGLIGGAHQNRGLGHEFLRHVARTRALVLVVDAAGSEGRNPAEDLRNVREELRRYDDDLSRRPAIVVANKVDLPGDRHRARDGSQVPLQIQFPRDLPYRFLTSQRGTVP